MDKTFQTKPYAGLIIYRVQRNVEYLLLNDTFSKKKHWSCPKGEIIGNEDEIKCALRETFESTGLRPSSLRIEEGFAIELKYLSGTKPKKVKYYLAQLIDSHTRLLPNTQGLYTQWFNQTTAFEKVVFKSMQDVIKHAQTLIESNAQKKAADDEERRSAIKSLQVGQAKLTQSEPALYKTRLCERFETEGSCPYHAKCSFAHGLGELRGKVEATVPVAQVTPKEDQLFKTRLCEKFMKERFCQYGPKCLFAHGEEELKVRPKKTIEDLVESKPTPQHYTSRYNHENKKNEISVADQKTNWRSNHQEKVFSHKSNNNHDNTKRVSGQYQTIHSHVDPTYSPLNEPKTIQDISIKPAVLLPSTIKIPNNKPTPPIETVIKQVSVEPTVIKQVSVEPTVIKKVPVEPTVIKQVSVEPTVIKKVSVEPTVIKQIPIEPLVIKKKTSEETRKSNKSLEKHQAKSETTEKSWMKIVKLSKEEQEELENQATKPTALQKPNQIEVIISELKKFFSSHTVIKMNGKISDDVKELTRIEMRNDLTKKQLLYILLVSLLEEDDQSLLKTLKSREHLFKAFVKSEEDQVLLLKAWDSFVQRKTSSLTKTANALSYWYDSELVEEDVFLKWYNTLEKDSLIERKSSKFIEWLNESEDEED